MAYDTTDGVFDNAQDNADIQAQDYASSDAEFDTAHEDQSWSYYTEGDDSYSEEASAETDWGQVPYQADDVSQTVAWPAEEENGFTSDVTADQGAFIASETAAYPDGSETIYAYSEASAAAHEAQTDGYDLYTDGQPAEGAEVASSEETQVLPVSSAGYVPVMRPEKLAQYHSPARAAVAEPYRQQDRALASLLDEDPEAEAAYRTLVSHREERKRRRRIYAVVAAVAVLTAVGVFALRDRFVSSSDDVIDFAPATYTVERSNFSSTVQSSGALQPASSVVVTPELPGIITEVRVKEGDIVKEGDVLFILKNDEVAKAISDANDQLKSAESTASNAATTVTNAYNAYNAAVDAYNASLAAGEQPEPVNEAELRAAITTAEAARDSANSGVTAARATLDAANKQAEKLTVKAPISGAVVSLGAVVGASVGGATGATAQTTSSTLAQIAHISQMKVTVQVNEIDISSISPGQTAKVTFSALSDLELTATVESIASVASGAGGEDGSFGGGGIVTYAVVLIIPEPDAKLKPGMTASVTIITQDVPDALVVPLSAVAENEAGESYVEVVIDEETFTTAERSVTLGARSTTEVVVSDGLTEGDVILIANPGGDVIDLELGDETDIAATDAVAVA